MTKTISRPPQPDLARRRVTAALVLAPIAAPSIGRAAAVSIEVWTGPSCRCCHDWIEHLQANGFDVLTHDGGNGGSARAARNAGHYGSCHTGAVGGYAVEGHVPAREIQRLLEERPDAIGLSVPAMPRGSPGMDGPVYGNVHDPYDVLLVGRDGSAQVYESYRVAAAPAAAADGAEHGSEGTVSAVDAAAGTITIAHDAVASASWPAMTMAFKLSSPAAAGDLRAGERVRFRFRIDSGMAATVTQISRAP